VRFGVLLPSGGNDVPPEEFTAVARQAEALGFHSAWVTDHVVMPDRVDSVSPYGGGAWRYPTTSQWFDPLVTLGWVGAVAPHLELGTTVLVLPLRQPLLIAKQIATLDRMSNGRVLLGIGVGWMKEEFDRIGPEWEHRGSRSEEMVHIMRMLWKGGPVTFSGRHFQLSESTMHPTPIRGEVPVFWGGHSEASLRHVARMGDGWHPTGIGLDTFVEAKNRLAALCHDHGRDPASVTIVVRAGRQMPLTEESIVALHEHGVQHLVVTPPDGTEACFEELRRIAVLAKLTPRNAG
jgi:probable F420-dependent oxidoreductase